MISNRLLPADAAKLGRKSKPVKTVMASDGARRTPSLAITGHHWFSFPIALVLLGPLTPGLEPLADYVARFKDLCKEDQRPPAQPPGKPDAHPGE